MPILCPVAGPLAENAWSKAKRGAAAKNNARVTHRREDLPLSYPTNLNTMKIATKLAICGGVALSSTSSSVQAFVPTTPAGTKCTTSSALNFFGGGSASKSDLDEEVRVGRR